MTRAFIYAGMPTVIASLWNVEDQATLVLMEHFYTNLRAGMGKAETLRHAQLHIQAEYPHPYYWAGFILSGDGGKIGMDATGGKSAFTIPISPWIWLVGSVGLLLIIAWGVRGRKRYG